MSMYAEKAREYFISGYNCAQSVALAFADDCGYDQKTIAMLSAPFGGGMGKLREVCGAVSGMLMVAGSKYGYYNAEDEDKKAKLYQIVQELTAEFKDKHEYIICRDLLGTLGKSTDSKPEEYYKVRPCEIFVVDAANIIASYIENH